MSTKTKSTKKKPAKTKASSKPKGAAARRTGVPKPAKATAHLKAQAAADQQNARLRDERAASPDGMTASERAMARSVGGKKARPAKPAAGDAAKRVSSLDAAATVLADSPKPMRSRDLITEMTSRNLWTSPAGKTPHVSLATAMSREIKAKGEQSRFKKVGPGLFAASAAGKGA